MRSSRAVRRGAISSRRRRDGAELLPKRADFLPGGAAWATATRWAEEVPPDAELGRYSRKNTTALSASENASAENDESLSARIISPGVFAVTPMISAGAVRNPVK
ncbi:hypothetical protein C8E83_0147 [Frondihabitans australicus]|uniref:Uncharacterized protein n=1 Tax=Frondihabitans australicus TaxID=386892 RepID=A0A495ID85_9MICO|nr:hypothetical protein C8E83_0147 [Frondihabitans australicus]